MSVGSSLASLMTSRNKIILALGSLSLLMSAPAQAQILDLVNNTAFVSIKQRSIMTLKAQQLAGGGYELAGGSFVSFVKWYEPRNPDLQFDFLTQFSPSFGLLWGFSTGEYGEKYTVQPAGKIGFILQHEFNEQSRISFSMTRLMAGGLKEKPCTADYGEIGGVQSVNCRLAATTLEPSATLQYLANIPAPDRTWLSLRFSMNF